MKKKTNTLKIEEILILQLELNHLLSLKINLKLKFKIVDLANKLIELLKPFAVTKNELFSKFGNTDAEGNIKVEEKSENFPIFLEEYKKLLDLDLEFSYYDITLSDIESIEMDKVPMILFKLLTLENEEN